MFFHSLAAKARFRALRPIRHQTPLVFFGVFAQRGRFCRRRGAMPPLRACRMGLRNLDGIQKLESVRCDRCGSCPDVLPRPQRSAVTSCAKPSRVWALLVPRNTGMVSCRCCVPAAWERSKPPPDCLYCALTGGAAHLSLPRNPDSELTLPGNGRPSGVFSGGGRTDSVEAFAGAQGQRGERGFEHGG
jgi:hypothetical protein